MLKKELPSVQQISEEKQEMSLWEDGVKAPKKHLKSHGQRNVNY